MNPKEFESKLITGSEILRIEHEKQILNAVLCKNCFDCGFAYMSIDGYPAWAYCKCKEGISKHQISRFRLPLVDHDMLRIYNYKDFPLKAFIPKALNSDSLNRHLELTATRFESSLRESESFWQSLLVEKNPRQD